MIPFVLITTHRLAPGAAADITLFDPATSWTIDRARFLSKSRNTPFHGWRVSGRVTRTFVGGVEVYARATDDGSKETNR